MFKGQKVGAVIVAAGASRRMGGRDKLFARLGGKTVLEQAVAIFEKAPVIERIVVVVSAGKLKRAMRLKERAGWQKVVAVTPGGARRQDSVVAGLTALTGCGWVLIHDAARPLCPQALLGAGLEAAEASGAAAPAVTVTDTIKEERDGYFTATLPRQKLRAVQTPQVFAHGLIKAAYVQNKGEFTDDAAVVEAAGGRVKLFDGSYINIKLTTPVDLLLARALWRKKEG